MKTFKSHPGLALLILLTVSLAFVPSCASKIHPIYKPGNKVLPHPHPNSNPELEKISAVLWFEYAAESRALYYQAFNIASNRLADAIATNCACAKLAVIMDVDETILDNAPFLACLIAHGQPFNKQDWQTWERLSGSKALPGATNFLQYAARCNVDIFYLSNRDTNEWDDTKANLDALGFPMVDKSHLLLVQSGDKGKESRRRYIESHYKVVLLMGDYLDDLSSVTNTIDGRFAWTDMNQEKFGSEFILLPNPMYGSWEDSIYKTPEHPKPNEQEKADIGWQKLLDSVPPGYPPTELSPVLILHPGIGSERPTP